SAFMVGVPQEGHAAYFFTRPLQFGSRGSEVERVQVLLKEFPELYPEGIVSGYYGPATTRAVTRFQTTYGMSAIGKVGPSTRAKLNEVAGRLAVGRGEGGGNTEGPPPSEPASLVPKKELVSRTSTAKPYFEYEWRASADVAGESKVGTPAPKPVVVLNGTQTIIPQESAAVRLANFYKIALVDTEEKWDDFTAGMFLEMLERLPRHQFGWPDYNPWEITLTNAELSNDVEIAPYTKETPIKRARINKKAFARSNPTLQPSTDGNADRVFYSNRLFRAILKIFYDDYSFMKGVIKERYGVDLGYADPRDEFQDFTIDELQFVAAVFEDLPSGFRNMPGLEKIVRRKNGLTNPVSPQAPAIAWVTLGYIEFMDFAFTSGQAEYIQRLIAHEMTHFLWHWILSEETKKQFMALSGWEEVKKDSWGHAKTTNFVSEYASSQNPDEDFAETISYYIYQPDFVRTIAPDKYNFVKNVVQGYEYVVLVDEKFTFQVFNLEPDTTFPGKIVGIDIKVQKTESGDNRVVIDLHLSPKYGDGAERAYMRLSSPLKTKTYIDQYFYPARGNKFLLRADFVLTKYAPSGYWAPETITVTDQVDNRRYESQKNFGWLLYVDDPEEDTAPPVPDMDNIKSSVKKIDGDDAIEIRVPVTDTHPEGMTGYATINQYASNQQDYDYADYDPTQKELVFLFPIRKYRASGEWTFREFSAKDIAENSGRFDLKDRAITKTIHISNSDYVKPALDVSSIKIQARPRKPQAPDGETDVNIWYRANDDNSGLGNVNYTILKPNGQSLFDYDYHDNFHTPYFIGNPNENKLYEIKLTLPPGSLPGTWILREISLHDKAGNILTSNFVEIGILRPFKVY
ncbi:MAG: putative zinc-binding metallopeptidase, partial [Patescibacteria group bacterium]